MDAFRAQLVAKRLVIEDLAVVRDDVPAARRDHRLMPFGRQIQDCQAPVTEPHFLHGIRPFAAPVRTAMREAVAHPPSKFGIRSAH